MIALGGGHEGQRSTTPNEEPNHRAKNGHRENNESPNYSAASGVVLFRAMLTSAAMNRRAFRIRRNPKMPILPPG